MLLKNSSTVKINPKMICPNCQKPFYFLSLTDKQNLKCAKCSHSGSFVPPQYSNYHYELYSKTRYDRHPKTDPQMDLIFRKMSPKNTDIVIDIGCGVGDYTKEIHKVSKNVTGIDIAIGTAKSRYPYINFLESDCNKAIPVASDSIDKIISVNLIEHLIDPERFLFECKRILKPNGKIALTTANLDFILHSYFFDKTHLYEWTLREFEKLVSKYFIIDLANKSSGMFKYYPINLLAAKFLKPDIIILGTKQ